MMVLGDVAGDAITAFVPTLMVIYYMHQYKQPRLLLLTQRSILSVHMTTAVSRVVGDHALSLDADNVIIAV